MAFEIYDFVDVVTADYDYTLTIKAQGKVKESGGSNQVVNRADNNSRETITLSDKLFYIEFNLNQVTATESGTMMDLYFDEAKAHEKARSFKWAAHDGHTYVVYFDCTFTRDGNAVTRWGHPGIRFEVKGKIADA